MPRIISPSILRIDRGLAFCIVLVFFMTVPWLWRKPFSSKGEAREALSAQAILQNGEWILPRRYGDEIAVKPPLFYWLIATASLPQGEVTPGNARLPSTLASVFTVACLYLFLARRGERLLGLEAALLLFGGVAWHISCLLYTSPSPRDS